MMAKRVVGDQRLASRYTSSPLAPGMLKSSKAQSGLRRLTKAMASIPFLAVPITFKPETRLIAVFMPSTVNG